MDKRLPHPIPWTPTKVLDPAKQALGRLAYAIFTSQILALGYTQP
jgi:hypothetical protein